MLCIALPTRDSIAKFHKGNSTRVVGGATRNLGELKELSLIDFITYNQDYDEVALNLLINKATESWRKVKDADKWLNEIRGGVNG